MSAIGERVSVKEIPLVTNFTTASVKAASNAVGGVGSSLFLYLRDRPGLQSVCRLTSG
jgi:hypothetical protein